MFKKNPPRDPIDYAGQFLEKTGIELVSLVNDGKSDEEIKMEFFKVGLRRPSKAYLVTCRKLIKDGTRKITDTDILDKMILLGFEGLKKGAEVSVGELLKALELKDKYRGTEPADIRDRVRGIFAGEKQLPEKEKKGKSTTADEFLSQSKEVKKLPKETEDEFSAVK